MSALRIMFTLLLLTFNHAAFAQDEDDREGGIIGTGIVGTITELGSIYVNEQHIFIDDALEVTGALGHLTAADLHPGHVVAVTVHPDGADWRAQSIRQLLTLVGPVEAVDDTGFTVLGTEVALGALIPPPHLGDWVAISGLWQNQIVIASRIDPVHPSYRQARISGTYFGPNEEGRNAIGGTAILGLETRHLQPGDLVRAFGQPTATGIEATRIEHRLFEDAIEVVQIEGYLSPPQPSGLYTVLGSGLVAYTDRPEMVDSVNRVILCGENGQFEMLQSTSPVPHERKQVRDRLRCAP
ncbi:DUF5666 domain-containing protein [Cochlodiniinecator piscidefendens]|uniref:DUF5666 domain-containing protein n=1 Tax=Cochlodiniinecator piscidefendens TaxID=2715756 RepID=UPI00140C238C|nr:DUF5666 domain-containing protein [Cochlodiniinecator piscidefendens]